MTLVINTLVYEADINKGVKQIDLVERIAELGADGIEIRREYFKNPEQEIPELAKAIDKTGMLCNYSVPDTIFDKEGNFNTALDKYYKEAKVLGAQKIKFSTGNFYEYTGDLAKDMENLPLADIQTTIENNQSPISGSPDTVYDFLVACRECGLNSIYSTFDMGNLAWVGFDPIWAAKKLSPFVAYIHLKNPMLNADGIYENTESMDKGMYNWKALVQYLPKDVQCAFEFAMPNDQVVKSEMDKFHKFFDYKR